MPKQLSKLIRLFLVCFFVISCLPPWHASALENDPSVNDPPQLYSRYAYLMDIDTGQVLYSKAGDERMYPASMTKIMTIVLAIDYLHDLQQKVPITGTMLAGLAQEGASCAGFRVGDSPTVEELLYGAALPSGADASNALAVAVSGTMEDFVDLMNRKAEELGMTGTHFMNAHGLHNENHYSTARDIAVLMKYCMEHELFREIISVRRYKTGRLYSHYNGISMRSGTWYYINTGVNGGYNIPGFEGGKTGYTIPAGRCLVSAATVNGMHMVAVAGYSLGATTHVIDTRTLYSWAGTHYSQYALAYSGTRLASIQINNASPEENEIKITLPDDVVYDLPTGTQISTESDFVKEVEAPLEEGTELGSYRILVDGDTIYEMIFKAQKTYDIDDSSYYQSKMSELLGPYAFIPGAALIAFILLMIFSRMIRHAKGRSKIRTTLKDRERMERKDGRGIDEAFSELSEIIPESEENKEM